MRWSQEAEKAVSKVPFFVRKRVRRRVEEEAIRVVDQCLDVYQEHCREGERFGEILERTGGVRIPVRSMDRPQGLEGHQKKTPR